MKMGGGVLYSQRSILRGSGTVHVTVKFIVMVNSKIVLPRGSIRVHEFREGTKCPSIEESTNAKFGSLSVASQCL